MLDHVAVARIGYVDTSVLGLNHGRVGVAGGMRCNVEGGDRAPRDTVVGERHMDRITHALGAALGRPSLDFSRPRRLPDRGARKRQLLLASALAAILGLGGGASS